MMTEFQRAKADKADGFRGKQSIFLIASEYEEFYIEERRENSYLDTTNLYVPQANFRRSSLNKQYSRMEGERRCKSAAESQAPSRYTGPRQKIDSLFEMRLRGTLMQVSS